MYIQGSTLHTHHKACPFRTWRQVGLVHLSHLATIGAMEEPCSFGIRDWVSPHRLDSNETALACVRLHRSASAEGARSRSRSNVEQGPARQVIQAPGSSEFLAPWTVSGQPQSRISFRSFSIWLSRSVAPFAQAQHCLLLERSRHGVAVSWVGTRVGCSREYWTGNRNC